MTAPNNLETTVNMVGQRESLSDVIHRVAPEKTPFISSIGKGSAKARYEEWQTETLAAPDADNASLEGDTYGNPEAPNRTTRIGNYCQIFDKKGGVSRTSEIVDKAGRQSEKKRQRLLKGIEMRRDMESRFIGNYASQNEGGANPRKSAGALAWLETNTSRGGGGSDGGFSAGTVTAATNGSQRAFTETLVKTVLASAFDEGGMPTIAMMGSTHKQQFSSFPGIADIRVTPNGRQAQIMAGADVYKSDFGDIQVKAHPYGLTRDCLIYDPEYFKTLYLDGFKTKEIGKNADGDQFLMTAEATLQCSNEKGHAVISDLA
jgi:hypothetical protein